MLVDTTSTWRYETTEVFQINKHLPQFRRDAAHAENSLHIAFNRGFYVYMLKENLLHLKKVL